jgi:hypothetical protein
MRLRHRYGYADRYAAAATYYVDATTGDDGYDGRGTVTPWKSIARVNSQMSKLRPGDTILLKCGEMFAGTKLNVVTNGTALLPITVGSYGSGARPIIDGQATVNCVENFGYAHWRFVGIKAYRGLNFGFHNSATADCWFTDCETDTAGNDGLIFYNGCTGGRVYGGVFHHSFDRTGGSAVATGIEIADGGSDFLVSGAEIYANPVGLTVHSHPGLTMPQQVQLVTVNSHDNTGNGFQCSSGDNADGGASLVLTGCTSQNNGQDGYAYGVSGATGILGTIGMNGCLVSGSGRYGVSTDKASGLALTIDNGLSVTVVRP